MCRVFSATLHAQTTITSVCECLCHQCDAQIKGCVCTCRAQNAERAKIMDPVSSRSILICRLDFSLPSCWDGGWQPMENGTREPLLPTKALQYETTQGSKVRGAGDSRQQCDNVIQNPIALHIESDLNCLMKLSRSNSEQG